MNYKNKLEERMNSKEGEAFLRKLAEEYKLKEEKIRIEKNNIIVNDDYIKWLEKFTSNGRFTDNDWLYFPEKMSNEDKENIDKLQLFYEIIKEFAEKSHIYPKSSGNNYNEYYFVIYNNTVFKIGYIAGQGTVFFCDKLKIIDENDLKNCIKFEDIKYNKIKDVSLIEDKLSALSEYIYSIVGIVPIEDIESLTNNIIKEVKSKNKTRKLK